MDLVGWIARKSAKDLQSSVNGIRRGAGGVSAIISRPWVREVECLLLAGTVSPPDGSEAAYQAACGPAGA